MSKFIKAFFALDLWIALSLITTVIVNMLFSHDQVIMITLSIFNSFKSPLISSTLSRGLGSL